MISVSNLNKFYFKGRRNENHVLKNINLDFEPTGLVCILGESGCGKTTFLNAIGGLDDFESGKIVVGNTALTKYSIRATEKMRNDNIGFVFQNYYLLMDYTVYYNIKIALNIYDLSEEEKDRRVNYVLEALNISKYRKKLVSELSGGQQQRVSIARALVKSPKIILADEPTGNLDEENTIRTMSILKSISKECLVIVVTHEKDIAKFFADRIIKFRDGEVYRDKKNSGKESYIKKYDSNIYLKELEKEEASLSTLGISLYNSNPEIDIDFEEEDVKTKNTGNKAKDSGDKTKGTDSKSKDSTDKNKEKPNKAKDSGDKTKGTDSKSKDSADKNKEKPKKAKDSGDKDISSDAEKKDNIHLTFAWKDGKLYIKNDSDTDVILTSDDDDCQIIDGYRPKLEIEEIEENEYNLPQIDESKGGRFSNREIRRIAHENLKIIGKKQFFIIVILIITSILMTLGIANYTNKIMTPVEDIVTMDSRYMQLSFEPTGKNEETVTSGYINNYVDEVLKDGEYTEMYPLSKNMMDIYFKGVIQIEKLSGFVENISYVAYNHLNPDDIVCGRMPENPDEVVLDEWVVNKFMKNKDVISELLNSNNAFLGQTIKDSLSGEEFEIVGVCKSNQPSVYVHDICLGYLGSLGIRAASVEQVEAYFKDSFKDADFKLSDIEDNKAVVSMDYFEKANQERKIHHSGDGTRMISVNNNEFELYRVTDINFGADFIVSNYNYNGIKFDKMRHSRSFIVYSKDPEKAKKYFVKMGEQFKDYFTVNAEITYNKQIDDYKKRILLDLNFATFLTLGIFIISLFMIYFMIKSNAMSRGEELTVYRLIGISRFSILKTYMLEITLLTSYFAIPAIIITTIVIKFIASIPSLQLTVDFPWWVSVILAVFLLLVNNIISVMPVYSIISKPPAKIGKS
ncbi:MAG: ATP-binding cassette domain-containing protein [Lachnospiraceae bacterium]|nr:ATP-binding cassette domain-containing protein [Lachnospiraceae bacterium]